MNKCLNELNNFAHSLSQLSIATERHNIIKKARVFICIFAPPFIFSQNFHLLKNLFQKESHFFTKLNFIRYFISGCDKLWSKCTELSMICCYWQPILWQHTKFHLFDQSSIRLFLLLFFTFDLASLLNVSKITEFFSLISVSLSTMNNSSLVFELDTVRLVLSYFPAIYCPIVGLIYALTLNPLFRYPKRYKNVFYYFMLVIGIAEMYMLFVDSIFTAICYLRFQCPGPPWLK